MKVAIMQPYIFPYLGYFQLIKAADTFVFYDDVNFIKGGWINRNNILVNKKSYRFTVSLSNMSSFSLISETKIDVKKIEKSNYKFLKTLQQSYKKAPFFEDVFPLVEKLLIKENQEYISQIAIDSTIAISNYLGLNTNFKISSKDYLESKGLEKIDRLIYISKKEKATEYINPIGGVDIYNKSDFAQNNVMLSFLKSEDISYKQFNNEFVPWLSIIDVMMFNSKEEINILLDKYTLI